MEIKEDSEINHEIDLKNKEVNNDDYVDERKKKLSDLKDKLNTLRKKNEALTSKHTKYPTTYNNNKNKRKKIELNNDISVNKDITNKKKKVDHVSDDNRVLEYLTASERVKDRKTLVEEELYKSKIERKINSALESREFDTAVKLSDELYQFNENLKLEKLNNITKETKRLQAEGNTKKKVKLSWGFDPKERWERKGNM